MRQLIMLGLLFLVVFPAGCSRTRYRMAADEDSYGLLKQKVAGQPWSPPSDYTLHPQPTSRLYDPTPLDDPRLPIPAPQLYSYELPELPKRSPRSMPAPNPELTAPPEVKVDPQATLLRLPPTTVSPDLEGVRFATYSNSQPSPAGPSPIGVVVANWASQVVNQPPANPAPSPLAAAKARNSQQTAYSSDIQVNPIPKEAWDAVPRASLTRMFEFEKIREEYRRSHMGADPPADQFAPGRRLSFEDIVELTVLNSREYQTQKETLYRAALRLSLQRFAYQLKFSPFANGVDVNWNHTRTAGTTVNGLGVPTRFQVEKMLATGGDFLARFANDVVLTFNGPSGFTADVSSEMFVQLNQTILQNDVRFENLTQAERDVIYAARDFTRFRKVLFNLLASQYYNLIRNYRQVEIDTQNYFTLVRAFGQSRDEFRTGFLPRFQLDQVEQNVLAGRSRLIGTCNGLESAIDNLKIRIGLPTETYVNVDLTELNQLTTRDELSVGGEQIRRVRQRLIEDRAATPFSRVVVLSSSIDLIERMLASGQLLQRTGATTSELDDLPVLLRRLKIEAARENTALLRRELQEELMANPPSIPIVFQRTLDLIDGLLELTARQLDLADLAIAGNPDLPKYHDQAAEFRRLAAKLHDKMDELLNTRQLGQLPQLVNDADALQKLVDGLVIELGQLLGFPATPPPVEELMRETLATADELLVRSQTLLQTLRSGLTPIEIDMDDAMLTALNLRLDLMNQRGDVADNWRQIKYAGDDLKSILNITASQRFRTPPNVNRVFDFSFDNSETRVSASFDAPFNRFAQRNTFRQSLIDYQVSLRQLMLFEDNIKLAVRNDLRNLALDKEQYLIDVASAALAYERVVSVLLELRLGIGRAATRDFLEAQNAYAASLSNVASRHIDYIIDRTQLFLDLELLTVGDDGFWHELYDETYKPEPYYQLPPYAHPAYGELVPGLWYSRLIRRLEKVPPGSSAIHEQATPPQAPAEEVIPVPVPE